MKMSQLMKVVACAYLAALLPAAAPPLQAQATGDEDIYDGQWQYNEHCASCHGIEGEGFYPFGVALRDNPFVQNAPAQALIEVIQDGRYENVAYPAYSAMPPFKFIRGAQARAIVSYMKGGLQQGQRQ